MNKKGWHRVIAMSLVALLVLSIAVLFDPDAIGNRITGMGIGTTQ